VIARAAPAGELLGFQHLARVEGGDVAAGGRRGQIVGAPQGSAPIEMAQGGCTVHEQRITHGWQGWRRKWLLANRGQTGLPANFRQTAPEIHGSLVSPRGQSAITLTCPIPPWISMWILFAALS